MAALVDLFTSKVTYFSAASENEDPPAVYVKQEGGDQGMAGDSFSEPFTLITSTAESFGSVAAEKASARGFLGHINSGKDWIASKHSKVKPWAEFFNPRNFSLPRGAGDVTSRLFGNVQLFQSNYLFVFLGLIVYCIVTNPTLLFALAFCFGAWWFIAVRNNSENVRLFGRDTSAKELYLAIVLICIPLFYIAGAGSTVFWIIGASVVLILVHAGMMAPPSSHKVVDEEMGLVMEEVTVS